jgi:uncharacterized membrane protein YfcA
VTGAAVALVMAVLIGSALQRLAGMGFAMVVAPFAILLLPGQQGVVFANLAGTVAALALVWAVRRDIAWKPLWILSGTALVGAVVGALVVRSLDAAVFRIIVGIVLLAAIAVSLFVSRLRWSAPFTSATVVTGGAVGLLVTMSGIGAPPLSVYSLVTDWDTRRFTATMQPFVALSSVIGAVAVLLAQPGSMPELAVGEWVAALVALGIGLLAGHRLHQVVPTRVASILVVTLGFVGAVTAVVSGVNALG